VNVGYSPLEDIQYELQYMLDPTFRVNDNFSDWLELVPCVVCKNGLTFSMQASSSHFCTPKSNDGPWTHVEIGYPSEHLYDLELYRGDNEEGVFGRVPIELVTQIVYAAGGLKDDA